MKTITTTAIFLFFSFCLLAQEAPKAFNYQGVARDLAGTPLPDKAISLRISILEGSSSGASVFQEFHNITTNELGLFNIRIGEGEVLSGDIAEIEWGGDDHFVQIEMDEDGGTDYQLIGTSQLLSVPYALYAQEAANGTQWRDVPGGILYDQKVNIGGLPSFLNYNLNIISDGSENNSGIQIINPNSSGRSIVLAGEGNQRRYIYMGYLGASYQPINSANQPETGLIYTGGRNGMTLMSQTGPITFVAGGGSIFDRRLFIGTDGNIGIGNVSPQSRLQVTNGDVYIENINRGVIMKSPNGQCWRYSPDNSGQLVPTAVVCPN